MKPAEWISDLPQWERLGLTDQIKSECYEYEPHGLVHFFIYPSIFVPSIHSFIFYSGRTHSHWNQGGFLSGNLLKAALGKIFMEGKNTSNQAKS